MIAELIQTMLLTCAISGGSVSERNTATNFINRTPKNDDTQIQTTNNYDRKLTYTNTENYINSRYSKYNAKNTEYTNFLFLDTYSYTKTQYINRPGQLTNNNIINYWNRTFISYEFYRQTYNTQARYKFTTYINYPRGTIEPGNAIANIQIAKFNKNSDINQYLNLNNLETLDNFTLGSNTTILSSYTQQLINQNQNPLEDNVIYPIEIDLSNYFINEQEKNNLIINIYHGNNTIENVKVMQPVDDFIKPNQFILNFLVLPNQYEIIDIPNLILTIITLPFTFISLAFGPITLFPNTPYQVNLGNLIMVLLTILLIIFVVTKIKNK